MSKLTKEIKVRIPPELKQQLEEIAQQEQRTLSQVVRIALAKWTSDREVSNCQTSTPSQTS